jgi:hypothetical protein
MSIPCIVWVEENADFLKFISITQCFHYLHQIYILNMDAKFEKCTVYISLKYGYFQCMRQLLFTLGFKTADFRKRSIVKTGLILSDHTCYTMIWIHCTCKC